MAIRSLGGKPIIVAGGNRAGAIPISSQANSQGVSVYSGAPVNAVAPKPVAPVAPVSQPTEFAPQVTQRAPVATPVLKAASGVPTDQVSSFGPGNSLINKQIQAPSAGANQFDKQAAQYAQQAGIGDYSKQTQKARNMIMKQLRQLQNAPDRFELAKSQYDIFQQQAEPAYQQALRGVGQKAAALGRVGAGMTTNDLTGVAGQHQNRLSYERQNLINQALQNTMGDRLGVSQALQSAGGLLGGQDLSMGQAQSQARLGQAGLFGNLGQQQFGREAFGSQLEQQQQGYQAGLDQQNIQNQIAQQQLQQGAQNQAWQQQYAQQALAAQIAAQQNTQYPTAGYPGSGYSSAQLGYQGY